MSKPTRKQIRSMHERDMALRRQKPKTFGRLKSHFTTKSGKRVANPTPTGTDAEGRPIYSAATPARVLDHAGNERIMGARKAARDMGDGRIPVQRLVALEEELS